jgi:predicted negative regulator of RcsB-dependent stress response
VDRITRKELKADKFALELGHTFTYFEEHRAEAVRYGAIAAGVLALVLVFGWYSRHQHGVREAALNQALQVEEASIGSPSPVSPLTFPTEEARQQEAIKRFSEVAAKYSGSDEAQIAQYYLATIAADQGKLAEAEKSFKQVAESGNRAYASLAQLSLAQIYLGDGRTAEGEKVLRALIEKPTVFVSKEQAALVLARGIMQTRPAEARKLVEPIRTVPGAIGQIAINLAGEIPAQ